MSAEPPAIPKGEGPQYPVTLVMFISSRDHPVISSTTGTESYRKFGRRTPHRYVRRLVDAVESCDAGDGGNEVKKGLEFVIIRYLISGQLESGTYSAGHDPVRQRFKRRRCVRSESSN